MVIEDISGKKPAWCEYYHLSKWKKNNKIFQFYKYSKCCFLMTSFLITVKNNLRLFIYIWQNAKRIKKRINIRYSTERIWLFKRIAI